jgi:hypothetical protein
MAPLKKGQTVNDPTDLIDKPKTIRLPNGNTAIQLGADLVDPVHLSVRNLIAFSPDRYATVLKWLEDERAARESRLAANEAELAETTARIRREAEARAAATEALKQAEPWRF